MTRRTMPYHRRYHGDALQGYMVLTLEERGAYTTILDLIYDNGGPLVFNERYLAGMMGVSPRKCRALVESLLAQGKLYLTRDKRISNHRAERELENAIEISAKRAESARQKGKSSEPARKANKNSPSRQQLQSKCAADAQPLHSLSTGRGKTAFGASYDAWEHSETPRKTAELDSEMISETREADELPYEINAPPEQMQSECTVIPEPYIDNNPLHSVAARETDGSHLVAALERSRNWRPAYPPSPAARIAGK